MENLAYLYMLAEEAALVVKNKPQPKVPISKQIQCKKPASSHQAPPAAAMPSVDHSKVQLDCDREHQPYTTFYL